MGNHIFMFINLYRHGSVFDLILKYYAEYMLIIKLYLIEIRPISCHYVILFVTLFSEVFIMFHKGFSIAICCYYFF